MLDELRNKARELLEKGAVKVVIGYSEGSDKNVRPIFIRNTDGIDRLIYDERCVQNLAVYLLKPEVKALGKPAIVATIPVMQTINQLSAECQISEDAVMVLGISKDGKILDLPDLKSMRSYISELPPELTKEDIEGLEKIERLSSEERWNFWQEKFSSCIKCYACRAACPLCYCSRCTVECNQPQWIDVPSHQLGNFEWHVMRAMHLAGRCVNCGDCFRACPLDIPLNLLTKIIMRDIEKNFGKNVNTENGPVYPLSTYNVEDKENFIK